MLRINPEQCYPGEMVDARTVKDTTRLLEAAIALAGSEEKLGKASGFSQNAIWAAKRRGRVTAEMAVAIERATAGAISRSRLRPDLFSEQAAAA